MKQFIWSIVKPAVLDWLKNRALQLSIADTMRIAQKLKIDTATVAAVNDEIKALAVAQFDKFKP